jgi:hypothetical protein
MNRLTAIGLASLVAYGLLIASKYTGVVSAARDERAPQVASQAGSVETGKSANASVMALNAEPRQATLQPVSPVTRIAPSTMSAAALDFRNSRDLKAFADGMDSRRPSLTGDERYYLAKALEECQFTTTINEDLAAYSAKRKREFLASLPAGDPNVPKRIAAYDAVDNTQRCIGFQNTKISSKDVEELYRTAAMQGDPKAQARMLSAEITKNNASGNRGDFQTVRGSGGGDVASIAINLLESRNPEAIAMVGDMLAGYSSQMRVGPDGRTPEPWMLVGGFSLVACDMGPDYCNSMHREPLQACAYAGYCAQNYEELYQTYLASPWGYTQSDRFRTLIHTAITTRDWALIGLVPPSAAPQGK